MLRVGVLGAGGRMGVTVCEAVSADEELELVAACDPHHVGAEVAGTVVTGDRATVADAEADVVVDFTVVDAARQNLPWLADQKIHAVVGTTGFTDADLDRFRAEFTDRACIIAPNFAISAVLMMRLAAMAAPYFDTAEVIELHHDRKIDAPSGTAALTAQRIAEASTDWASDPTQHELLPGVRGAAGPAGVRLHSVRMRGLVAHHEVILGAEGQSLTIRQDSYDRSSFMPGVLAAVKAAPTMPGLTVGLDAVLGL